MEKWEEREPVVLENHGQKIFGVLHLPLRADKRPAVLMCHGLGGHKTGKFRAYVDIAEQLAKEGIASLRIDFRGSGDSEGRLADATFFGEVADTVAGLKFLQKERRVDASRLGLFGRSMGGAVAVQAAAQFKALKSLALWAPVFSGDQWKEKWEMALKMAKDQKSTQTLQEIDGQVPSMNFYAEMFGMELDKKLETLSDLPLFHVQGEQDEVVSISQADGYAQVRKNANATTKFLRFPEGDHDFSKIQPRTEAIRAIVQWFKQTL